MPNYVQAPQIPGYVQPPQQAPQIPGYVQPPQQPYQTPLMPAFGQQPYPGQQMPSVPMAFPQSTVTPIVQPQQVQFAVPVKKVYKVRGQ